MRPVVPRINNDSVVRNTKFVKFLQQHAHMVVVLKHAVGIKVQPRFSLPFLGYMGEEMHAGRCKPNKKGFFCLVSPLYKIKTRIQEFLINGFHALFR